MRKDAFLLDKSVISVYNGAYKMKQRIILKGDYNVQSK